MAKRIIKLQIILLPILFLLIFSFKNHESNDSQEIRLTINKPYLSVIRALASKESLEKIIEQNHAKLVYKKWNNFSVEVPKRILQLKEYELDGEMDFIVEKHDNDLGDLRLYFQQLVNVNKEVFSIKTQLKQPEKGILICDKFITISPGGLEITKIFIESEVKVKKMIPFFADKIMDSKLIEFNKSEIENIKLNLLKNTDGANLEIILK